jgi:hypothetical protein
MQKKASTRTKNFGSVTLYRAELDALLDLFHANVIAPRVSDRENNYDDLNDLQAERGEVVHDLSITGLGNECEVKIQISRRLGSNLEVVNNDAAFLSLSDILKKRYRNILYYALLFLSILSVGCYFGFAIYGHRKLTLVSLGATGITAGLFMFCHLGKFSQVYLTRKHQTSSFWRRNKDEIVRQLISNILAFGLGLVAAYFLFKQGIK